MNPVIAMCAVALVLATVPAVVECQYYGGYGYGGYGGYSGYNNIGYGGYAAYPSYGYGNVGYGGYGGYGGVYGGYSGYAYPSYGYATTWGRKKRSANAAVQLQAPVKKLSDLLKM